MSSSKEAEAEAEPAFQLFTSLRYDPILLQSPLNIQYWPLPSPTPCPFYMLPYHRDRLQQAATHFSWPIAINAISGPDGFQNLLTTLSKNIDTSSPTPLRVRIVLDHKGILTVETNPVPAVSPSNLFPTHLPLPSNTSPLTPQTSISPPTGDTLTLSTTDFLPNEPLKSFNSSPPYTIIPDPSLTTPSPYTTFKTTSRTMYDTARSRAQIDTFTEPKEVLLVSPNGEIMEGSLTTPFFYRDGKWVTPSDKCGGQIGTTRRWALEKGLTTQTTIPITTLTENEECWISNGVRGFTFGRIKFLL